MSVEGKSWALAQTGLSSNEKFLLFCLGWRANSEGVAWPSIDHLADMTGLNRRSVFRHLKTLEKRGLITRNRRQNRSTVYVLHIDSDDNLSPPDDNLSPQKSQFVTHKEKRKRQERQTSLARGAKILVLEEERKVRRKKTAADILDEIERAKPQSTDEVVSKHSGQQVRAGVLEAVWKGVHSVHHPDKFVAELTMRQKGQLSQIIKKLKDQPVIKIVAKVVEDWEGFTAYVRGQTGAWNTPKAPQIGFVLRYVSEAAEFWQEHQNISSVNLSSLTSAAPKSENKVDPDEEAVSLDQVKETLAQLKKG